MAGRVTIRLNRPGVARITHVRVERVTNSVLNSSRRRVNVDTGRLRSTGYKTVSGNKGTVGYRTNYARFVHDGTRYMRGSFYLTRAVAEVLKRYARRG